MSRSFLFQPSDPFPLISESEYNYSLAKEHAEKVDEWLGLHSKIIEEKIQTHETIFSSAQEKQLWSGLPVQSLMTPYLEIRILLDLLKPKVGEHLVDLGCAYARIALVLEHHYPGVQFTGYEISLERVHEAQRILKNRQSKNSQVFQKDLSAEDLSLVSANYYFIYDYGTAEAISKTLQDLKRISSQNSIQVIARGGRTRQLVLQNHPWLSEVNPVHHSEYFSIFKS